jgi:hypothetical protein
LWHAKQAAVGKARALLANRASAAIPLAAEVRAGSDAAAVAGEAPDPDASDEGSVAKAK